MQLKRTSFLFNKYCCSPWYVLYIGRVVRWTALGPQHKHGVVILRSQLLCYLSTHEHTNIRRSLRNEGASQWLIWYIRYQLASKLVLNRHKTYDRWSLIEAGRRGCRRRRQCVYWYDGERTMIDCVHTMANERWTNDDCVHELYTRYSNSNNNNNIQQQQSTSNVRYVFHGLLWIETTAKYRIDHKQNAWRNSRCFVSNVYRVVRLCCRWLLCKNWRVILVTVTIDCIH